MSAKKKRAFIIKPEHIVRALSKKLDIDLNLKDYPDKREVWECPFGIRCLQKDKIIAERMWRVPKSGFSNLFSHMASCCDGGEDGLVSMYENALARAKAAGVDASKDGNIRPFLDAGNVSDKARTIHGWLKWIAEKNMPLTAVQDDVHREFSQFKINISYQTLVDVMGKVVELVEGKLKKELEIVMAAGGKAAIAHDGWTSSQNEHYVGLFLSYCRPNQGRMDGLKTTFWIPETVLLACSPMDHHPETDALAEAAVTFNAEQHEEFIRFTLSEYYGIDIHNGFITNQTTDNAKVNLKIGRLLGIPTVGCLNHRFNLEMELFVEDNCKDLIESVRKTMVSVSTSCKLRARLRHHTKLVPLFYNDTRWYGKYFMLKRWLELYDHFKTVNQEIRAQEGGVNAKYIVLQGGVNFKNNVSKFATYFEKFHNTHVAMEKRGLRLCDCRNQLDSWVTMMEADLPVDHDLFGCDLEMKYISDNAEIIENANFERGVVKIQRNEAALLTDAEKEAVKGLRRVPPAVAADAAAAAGMMDDPDPIVLSSPTKLASAMDRKREREQATAGQDAYINCDYITGSVAEVERLWSLARHILTYERMSTKPINVEALLFLKANKRFWDEVTVQKAMDAHEN